MDFLFRILGAGNVFSLYRLFYLNSAFPDSFLNLLLGTRNFVFVIFILFIRVAVYAVWFC